MRRLLAILAKAIGRDQRPAPRPADHPFGAGAYVDDFHRRARLAIRGGGCSAALSEEDHATRKRWLKELRDFQVDGAPESGLYRGETSVLIEIAEAIGRAFPPRGDLKEDWRRDVETYFARRAHDAARSSVPPDSAWQPMQDRGFPATRPLSRDTGADDR